MKHQKVTDFLGKPSRGRQEILTPWAPDLYSLDPKIQTGLRYLTTITVSSLTAGGGRSGEMQITWWPQPALGAASSLAP